MIALKEIARVYLLDWQQGIRAEIDSPGDSSYDGMFRGAAVRGDTVIVHTLDTVFELDAATGELRDSGIADREAEGGTSYVSMEDCQGLRDIIVSGAQGYISGGRTLEDAVDIIQSKASIYMAEKYG